MIKKRPSVKAKCIKKLIESISHQFSFILQIANFGELDFKYNLNKYA